MELPVPVVSGQRADKRRYDATPATIADAGAERHSIVQTSPVRIGTWNLQGRWDERHLHVLKAMRCEILLLTEVSARVSVPGATLHATQLLMAPRRYWAAVVSTDSMRPLTDPHGASAMAEVAGLRVCASVLPWRSCGSRIPWTGSNTAERTAHAVESIRSATPTVWGGDWNHALCGPEGSGSKQGRGSILQAVDQLGLQVATAEESHQIDGLLSIDHIAVPTSWTVRSVKRYPASIDGAQISDHDAYVVDVKP